MGGEEIGFDGGKRVKGRKRTILVDTMGLYEVKISRTVLQTSRMGHCPT